MFRPSTALGKYSDILSLSAEDDVSLSSQCLNKHEALERFSPLFEPKVVSDLGSADWKVRLEGMEAVLARARQADMGEHCSVLVQTMAHLPGWEEKNFQVGGMGLQAGVGGWGCNFG